MKGFDDNERMKGFADTKKNTSGNHEMETQDNDGSLLSGHQRNGNVFETETPHGRYQSLHGMILQL